MTFPPLENGQFAVVLAEFDTGIVLTSDGERYTGNGETYHIFTTLGLARAFASEIVHSNPRVECNIYDSDHALVERVTRES